MSFAEGGGGRREEEVNTSAVTFLLSLAPLHHVFRTPCIQNWVRPGLSLPILYATTIMISVTWETALPSGWLSTRLQLCLSMLYSVRAACAPSLQINGEVQCIL